MIRTGFWGFLIILIVSNTPKPYSNFKGPYIRGLKGVLQAVKGSIGVDSLLTVL